MYNDLKRHHSICTLMIKLLKVSFLHLIALALMPAFGFIGTIDAQNAEPWRWRLLESESHPTKRHENAYAGIGDKFYLVGGRGDRPVEIFDPLTNSWTTGAAAPLSMHHFQAVAYQGMIYVVAAFNGGYPDEKPISHVYIYDPAEDRWTAGPEIPDRYRRGAAGAVVYGDKIYVVAGIRNGHIDGHTRRLDTFDPATGAWKSLAKPPRHRDHFHAAIIDGKLYAAGGRRTSQATGRVFELTIPEVDVYDLSTGEWTVLPPSGDIPTERAGTSAVSVGRYLVVLGGESGAQQPAHAEVEALNTETGHWHSLDRLNRGRHGTQAVVHRGRIYIAAGSETRGATEINSQEMYVIPDSLR